MNSRILLAAIIVFAVFCCSTTCEAALTDNLIGYWPLDGNGQDATTGDRHATLFGNAGFAQGLFGQALHGRIDEVAIWNRALSDAEVAFLFNGGQGNPVIVPEPSTLVLLFGGVWLLLVQRFCRHTMRYLVVGCIICLTAAPALAQTIPLGNLFDDPKGTNLSTAIATDTYSAIADVGDLGVFGVGSTLDQPIAITPSRMFNFASAGGGVGSSDNGVMNDASIGFPPNGWPIRTLGILMPGGSGLKIEDGVGMHANLLVSFDLDEIRAAAGLPPTTPFRFSAKGAINDIAVGSPAQVRLAAVISAGNDLTGYLNGLMTPIVVNSVVAEFDPTAIGGVLEGRGTTSAVFDLTIPGEATHLTLASLAVDSIESDHAVFSGAQLTAVPEPSTFALCFLSIACLIPVLAGKSHPRRAAAGP